MSHTNTINGIVDRLLVLERPTARAVGDAVGVKLERNRSTSVLDIYDGLDLFDPLTRVEIKVHKRDNWVLLVLDLDLGANVTQDAVVAPSDDRPTMSASPHAPPEGLVDSKWEIENVDVIFQATTKTKRLQAIVVQFHNEGRPAARPPMPPV